MVGADAAPVVAILVDLAYIPTRGERPQLPVFVTVLDCNSKLAAGLPSQPNLGPTNILELLKLKSPLGTFCPPRNLALGHAHPFEELVHDGEEILNSDVGTPAQVIWSVDSMFGELAAAEIQCT